MLPAERLAGGAVKQALEELYLQRCQKRVLRYWRRRRRGGRRFGGNRFRCGFLRLVHQQLFPCDRSSLPDVRQLGKVDLYPCSLFLLFPALLLPLF